MAEARRVTVRLTDEQVAAVAAHGSGDLSRGVRLLIAEHLAVGPVELAWGLSGADQATRRRVARLGARAKYAGDEGTSVAKQRKTGRKPAGKKS